MAEVEAPEGQDSSQFAAPPDHHYPPRQHPHHPLHGRKRTADSALEGEQRLSKRFDLLNLVENNGTRLYIPVPGSSDATTQSSGRPIATPKPLAPHLGKRKQRGDRRARPRNPPPEDSMLVEDTPNRVYIHDLAAELSDIESDEENPIFLSDIEKHLSKIPKHVLVGPEPKPTEHNQMVLYNVPSSLSVPHEHDNVRKAIVEARQRIRDRQANPLLEPSRASFPSSANEVTTTTITGTPGVPAGPQYTLPASSLVFPNPPTSPPSASPDADAMDID